jgi:hypothetical protein
MTEFKESSPVDQVLSLTTATDQAGQEFLLLALHFESDTSVRLPIPVAVAMEVWALLDKLRQDRGWSAPATPASTDQLQ